MICLDLFKEWSSQDELNAKKGNLLLMPKTDEWSYWACLWFSLVWTCYHMDIIVGWFIKKSLTRSLNAGLSLRSGEMLWCPMTRCCVFIFICMYHLCASVHNDKMRKHYSYDEYCPKNIIILLTLMQIIVKCSQWPET